MGIRRTRSVAHEPASYGLLARRVYCGDPAACRQEGHLDTPVDEKGAGADKKRIGALAHNSCEGRIDLAAGVRVQDLNLQPHDRYGSMLLKKDFEGGR